MWWWRLAWTLRLSTCEWILSYCKCVGIHCLSWCYTIWFIIDYCSLLVSDVYLPLAPLSLYYGLRWLPLALSTGNSQRMTKTPPVHQLRDNNDLHDTVGKVTARTIECAHGRLCDHWHCPMIVWKLFNGDSGKWRIGHWDLTDKKRGREVDG